MLRTRIVLHKELDGATSTYLGMTSLGLMGLPSGVELIDGESFTWGDACTGKTIVENGQKRGNVFVARNGTRDFFTLVFGRHLESASSLRELLEPRLNALETMTP